MKKIICYPALLIFLSICLFLMVSVRSEAAVKISLDKDFKLIGSRLLPAGEIIILEAMDIPQEIDSIILTIKLNTITTDKKVVNVAVSDKGKRTWSVEIGPFPQKSRVQVIMGILKPITDDQKSLFKEKLDQALKKGIGGFVASFKETVPTETYNEMLKALFLQVIKDLDIAKSLRMKTGDPLEKGIEDLFQEKIFSEKLRDYVSQFQDFAYDESILNDELAELRVIVKDKNINEVSKQATNKETFINFWTKIKENKLTIDDLTKMSETDLKNVLGSDKTTYFSKSSYTYVPAILDQSQTIQAAKKALEGTEEIMVNLAMVTVNNLRQEDLEVLDLEVTEIEHWAGFNVGYFGLTKTETVLPAFVIDIHPWRFDPNGASALWSKEKWWKLVSLSVGLGLTKLNKADREDNWYFIGIGLRINPFFRIHLGQTFTFIKTQENTGTSEKRGWNHEWSFGVSLNVRELAHVLALFGGLSQQAGSKE